MGGNTGVVLRQQANAQTAIKNKCAMAPDNGLAPGMACNILAVDGINKLVGDNYEVDDVVIRVGGLPLSDWDLQQLLQKEADPVAQKELEALLEDTDRRFFSPLKYLLVFSIWGLINEYMGHSLAIRDGKIVAIPTMAEEEREPVIIDLEDPEVYEAILTSGGISLIPYAYRGIVKNMIYETIRYAGHGPIIKAFIEMGFFAEEELAKVHIGEKGKIVPAQFFRQLYSPELLDQDNVQSAAQYLGLLNTEEITVTPDEDGYITPREVFAQIAQSILHNPQEKDKILIQVEVTGHRDGKMKRLTYNYNTLNAGSYGKEFSEMGRLTAFPVAILAMMMARGEFPYAGAGGIEKIVDTEKFIQYMQERGINIQVTVDEEINNHTAATAADLAQKIRAQTQPATPASESPPTPFTHSV